MRSVDLALALAPSLALVWAGCVLPGQPTTPATPTTVPDVKDAGGHVECHSQSAQTMTVPFRAAATNDSGGRGPGIHRLNESAFLWVWASYNDTLREDSVARINAVEAHREPEPGAPISICTRIDISAPTEVDREARSYDVAVLITATRGLPDAPLRVVVNWIAGCSCAIPPKGNATALFDAATPAPQAG